MIIGMFSAISLMCVDTATAARPLPTPEIVTLAQVQTAADDPAAATPAALASDAAAIKPTPSDADVAAPEEQDDPLVFAGKSDEDVVDALIAYLEGISTLSGDFTQIAPSGAASTGRFFLKRPGLLRFEYDPPTPLLIVANGDLVYVRDDALETTDSYPVGKTPLKFLLRKKVATDDVSVIGVDRGVDSVAVTFASDEDETEGELTIIARAPDFQLTRWIVRDLQNGITVVTLENLQNDIRLANRLFEAPEAGGRFLKD